MASTKFILGPSRKRPRQEPPGTGSDDNGNSNSNNGIGSHRGNAQSALTSAFTEEEPSRAGALWTTYTSPQPAAPLATAASKPSSPTVVSPQGTSGGLRVTMSFRADSSSVSLDAFDVLMQRGDAAQNASAAGDGGAQQIMRDNTKFVSEYASTCDRGPSLQSRACATYSVLINALSTEEREQVMHELTLVPKPSLSMPGAEPPTPIPVYEVDGELLHVPRPYGVHRWGPAMHDGTFAGRRIGEAVRCIARPRDEAQQVTLSALRDSYGALRHTGSEWLLAQADCGCGKTIMAVMHWLASVVRDLKEYACPWYDSRGRQRRRPPVALFMPPTKILRDQWAAEIRAICPRVNLFILENKAKAIPDDADCIVALPHTVCLCDAEKFRCVGFCVLDEAHHLTAQTFWEAVKRVAARRVLFLTATPRRNDGLTKKLLMLTGPTAARVERPPMPVDARFVLYRKGARRKLRYGHQLAYGKMLNWLCEDDQRNTDIAHYVVHALVREHAHRVLVISERSDKIKHLDLLADKVVSEVMSLPGGIDALRRDERKPAVPPERFRSRVPMPALSAPATPGADPRTTFLADLVSIIRPGMLSYEQELAKCARVVFAPRKSCDQGFNKSDFTHEIYASPFTDVEQCDGRVQRTSPGKSKCVIYHVVDTFEPYSGYGLKVWRWRTHADRARRMYTCTWVDEDLQPIATGAAMACLTAGTGGYQVWSDDRQEASSSQAPMSLAPFARGGV